jgi:hypothetical protein
LNDYVFQHDLSTTGVVGEVLVGDDPNKAQDQPASVAITPDGKTVAALEFISNNIDLSRSITLLSSTKYIISGNQFSGLSLVNLSNTPTKFTIYATDNYGQTITADGLTNPVDLTVGPNGQVSKAVSELFAFDLSKEQTGRLSVYADQPQVTGYFSIGQIQATWLGYYLNSLDGAPLFQKTLSDWVIPQILTDTGQAVQMEFVNPNYSQQTYDLKFFSRDGTLSQDKSSQTLGYTNRLENNFSDLFTTSAQSKVLITGGQTTTAANTTSSSAETYDTSASSFTAASGSMTVPRQGHTSTLMLNGGVLVTGGKNGSTILSSAEVYNLVTTKNISTISRDGTTHIVTLVFAGQINWAVGIEVVVAGVQQSSAVDAFDGTFTIKTISFSAGTGLTTLTYDQSSGNDGSGTAGTGTVTYNAAGTFTATGSMLVERYRHTATLLQSGSVLLAGGQNSTSVSDTAEIYDPTTSSFSATAGKMSVPRDGHTATLLPSGKVLIAGGINGDVISGTAELYDPSTGLFTLTGNMTSPRVFHTASLLANGTVLITGGYNGSYLNTAEIYDPIAGVFRATGGAMNAARDTHSATVLSDGRVLIAGGTDGSGALSSAEIYDPSTDRFSVVASPLIAARGSHTATLLPDDKVLLAGGTGACTGCCTDVTTCTGVLNTTEIYDPAAESFASGPTMTAARSGQAATFLESSTNGYVRAICKPGLIFTEIFGGTSDAGMLNGIDLPNYDGVTRLYAPQFANTSGFSTRLNLVNGNASQDAQVTVILHGPDGRLLTSPYTQTIPVNGQLEEDINNMFGQDPSIRNASGWLEVDSSVDRVVGAITFTNSNSTLFSSLELSGNPLSHFVFPIAAEDGTYQTGIALLNTNSTGTNVTLELWGPDGTLIGSKTVNLGPGTRMAQYLSDFFPNLSPLLVANIRVSSDLPIHGIAIMNDRSLHFVAAIPAVPFPEAP